MKLIPLLLHTSHPSLAPLLDHCRPSPSTLLLKSAQHHHSLSTALSLSADQSLPPLRTTLTHTLHLALKAARKHGTHLLDCLFALAYHLAAYHTDPAGGDLLNVVRELEAYVGNDPQVRVRLAEVCLLGGCERRAERLLRRGDPLVGEMLLGGGGCG
jgi:hypothetical protein